MTTLEEIINNPEEKRYNKIKNQKQDKYKKILLKTWGEIPLMIFVMFSSLSLAYLSTFYIFVTNPEEIKPIFGDFTITILFSFLMSILTLIYLLFFSISIILYTKSHSLNDKEKTKKE